jgi:hypothetical protein
MSDTSTFEVNLGSSLTKSWNWDNGEGGNADLTDYSIEIFQPDAAIAPYISVSITDPLEGLIELHVEYSETFRVRQNMKFRIRILRGDEKHSTNELGVMCL